MTPLEKFYKEHYTQVYAYVLTLCRNASVAEEVTGEAFAKAIASEKSFRGECSLSTWLCRIARNCYYSDCRKEKHREAEAECIPVNPDPSEVLQERAMAQRIRTIARELPEPYGAVFLGRVEEEKSYGELAAAYGKSETWARVVYHRAKEKIQEVMRSEGYIL